MCKYVSTITQLNKTSSVFCAKCLKWLTEITECLHKSQKIAGEMASSNKYLNNSACLVINHFPEQ